MNLEQSVRRDLSPFQAADGGGAMGVFLYSKARQHAPMPNLEVLPPVTINGIYPVLFQSPGADSAPAPGSHVPAIRTLYTPEQNSAASFFPSYLALSWPYTAKLP